MEIRSKAELKHAKEVLTAFRKAEEALETAYNELGTPGRLLLNVYADTQDEEPLLTLHLESICDVLKAQLSVCSGVFSELRSELEEAVEEAEAPVGAVIDLDETPEPDAF